VPFSWFCIVDYQMKAAKERLSQMGLPLYSLTDFESLVSVAVEDGLIDRKGGFALRCWHDEPKSVS